MLSRLIGYSSIKLLLCQPFQPEKIKSQERDDVISYYIPGVIERSCCNIIRNVIRAIVWKMICDEKSKQQI
jgi:hypothetical protein